MKILSTVHTLMKYIGFQLDYSTSIWYKLYGWMWLLLMVQEFIPQFMYFLENLSDILKASDTFLDTMVIAMTTMKGILYLSNYSTYKDLYTKMQNCVSRRIAEGYSKRYFEAERTCKRLTIFYYVLIALTILNLTMYPVFIAAILFYYGNLRTKDWRLPYKTEFFYDVSGTPLYELAYANQAIATIAVGFVVGVCDSLVVGITIYITAMFKDLQDVININFNKCFDQLQVLANGMIFLQYLTSILVMCLAAFLTSVSSDNALLISYLAFLASLTFELFLFSWYGHELTFQGQKVADAIYCSLWYRQSSEIRDIHRFIVMRAQRAKYLSGFRFFKCSMESFASVLSATGSTLALLQTLSDKNYKTKYDIGTSFQNCSIDGLSK